MNLARRILLTLLACSVWLAAAAEQHPGKPVSPFRLYTSGDGMTQTRAHAITQDQRGYLWIATVRGLNRFDGKVFTPLTIRHGLRVNTQFSLHVDSKGDLWSGDVTGGVTRVRDGRVVETLDPPGEIRGRAQSIAVLAGKLYRSVAGHGLYETDLSTGQTRPIALDAPAPSKLLTSDGRLLFIAADRLYAWRPGAAIADAVLRGRYQALDARADGRAFAVDIDGNVLALTGAQLAPIAQRVPEAIVAIALDAKDGAWHATANTLIAPDGDQLPLPVGEVIDVFTDRDDVVWVAGSNGLVRYLGGRFQHLPLGPSAPARVVFGGVQDRSGALWFCTEAGLLVRYPNGRVLAVADVLELPPGRAVAAELDGQDHLLVSFPPTGVYRIPVDLGQKAVRLPATEGWLVTDITHTTDAATWVLGARRGLLRFDDAQSVPTHLQLPDGGLAMSMAAVDEGGSSWPCAMSALLAYGMVQWRSCRRRSVSSRASSTYTHSQSARFGSPAPTAACSI
ncbi:MAG: hypothetical protein AAGA68_17580 [Pseudomonadota bacterium]